MVLTDLENPSSEIPVRSCVNAQLRKVFMWWTSCRREALIQRKRFRRIRSCHRAGCIKPCWSWRVVKSDTGKGRRLATRRDSGKERKGTERIPAPYFVVRTSYTFLLSHHHQQHQHPHPHPHQPFLVKSPERPKCHSPAIISLPRSATVPNLIFCPPTRFLTNPSPSLVLQAAVECEMEPTARRANHAGQNLPWLDDYRDR